MQVGDIVEVEITTYADGTAVAMKKIARVPVVYVHPKGRYVEVMTPAGYRDTIYPSSRPAHRQTRENRSRKY